MCASLCHSVSTFRTGQSAFQQSEWLEWCDSEPDDDDSTLDFGLETLDFLQIGIGLDWTVTMTKTWKLWLRTEAGLFLQFLFEGRVCLSGKELRVWSAARPEIQSTFVAAMDFARSTSSLPTTSSSDNSQPKQLNAIQLARELCKSYVAQEVTMLVLDDDESASLKRIANVMSTQYAAVALPLKEYIAKNMKLPLVLHTIVKTGAQEFLSCILGTGTGIFWHWPLWPLWYFVHQTYPTVWWALQQQHWLRY